MISFEAVAAQALTRASVLVSEWLPGGRVRGHEYVCGSLEGGPGDSFSVNLLTGKWADFAHPDQKGGDLISLSAAVHRISQLEAAKELDETPAPVNGHNGHAVALMDEDPEPQAQRPPNADFQPSLFKHPRYGTPVKFWVYRDAEGPLSVVARYDITGGGKTYLPWTWNSLRWRPKGPDKPRPLYGLDRLANLSGPVLLAEGEKAADAAQHFWPKRPCMTWPNGTGGVSAADWEPLRGLDVTLWPDADEPGRKAMAKVAEILIGMDCTVRVVDVAGMPEGTDLADYEAEGRSAADLKAYALAHMIECNPPQAVVPEPAPGSQVYEPAAPRGSLVEMWERFGFVRKTNGTPYMNQANVSKAIDVRGDMDIFYDSFAQRIMSGKVEWSDEMTSRFTHFLQTQYGLSDIKPHVVFEGVRAYAYDHQRNPPAEWLNSLTWDGEERLADLIHVGMGSRAGEYGAAVGRCFMVGMVARVLQPGCKVDTMPIFEGAQGAGKSSALKIIGGDYFAEIHESINSKDFYIAITGKMLCEISELNSLRRADVERIKGILTTATDRFRAPYGTTAIDRPRACVFAGTTNSDDWNHDETGARRFWPVRCGQIDGSWLSENRTQLFAESVARYRAGEQWWNVPEEQAQLARLARHDSDIWTESVYQWAESREGFTTAQVIAGAIEMDKQDATQADQNRVSKILRMIGFESRAKRDGGRVVRRWMRKA